jgi:hypothetical protein
MARRDEDFECHSRRIDRRQFLLTTGIGGTYAALHGKTAASEASATQSLENDPGAPASPRSRAIVIGINETSNAPPLVHPVKDACRFAAWLCDPHKGGLSTADVVLLTSPSPPPPDCITELNALKARRVAIERIDIGLASRQKIKDAIKLVACSPGLRERLYFFFSGHGSAYVDRNGVNGIEDDRVALARRYGAIIKDGDGLFACDYHNDLRPPLDINWIIKQFDDTLFDEQFFFFDACRDFQTQGKPFGGDNFECDPVHRRGNNKLGPAQQFFLFPTPPGGTSPDNKGTFSDILMDCLNHGKGSSKLYDESSRQYLVRWADLVKFLRAHFRANKIPVGKLRNESIVYLEPDADCQPRDCVYDTTPVLARLLPVRDVASVNYVITIDPELALADSQIYIRPAVLGEQEVHLGPPLKSPMAVPLQPLPHLMYVEPATGYYYPNNNTLIPVDDLKNPPLPIKLIKGNAPKQFRLADFREFSRVPSHSLTVSGRDGLSMIEVAHVNGSALRNARQELLPGRALGRLELPELESGIYDVRITFPSAPTETQTVVLLPGAETALEPKAKPGPPSELARRMSDFLQPHMNGQDLAPESTPEVILAQAFEFAVNFAHEGDEWGDRLARIGLKPLPGNKGGFQFIVGIEGELEQARTTLGTMTLALGHLRANAVDPLQRVRADFDGVAVFTAPTEPGHYRLRWTRPGERVEFALTLLPRRFHVLIIIQSGDGEITVTQFAPEIKSDDPLRPDAVRTLIAVQRGLQYRRDQSNDDHTRAVPLWLEELKQKKVVEPFTRCINAYLIWSRGKPSALIDVAKELIRDFPDLADGYVALARAEEATDHLDSARDSYREALRHGLPILSCFFDNFVDGAVRLGLEGDSDVKVRESVQFLRRVAQRRVPGVLWSSWKPDDV